MNPSKQLTSLLHLRRQFFHIQPRAYTFTTRTSIHNLTFLRTMASNASNNPNVEAPSEQSDTKPQGAPLPLPEPASSDATQLNVNGEGVKLDHLGPLVVNKDGTLSRIANWDKMAEIEKQNTLRILGKRNQLRMGELKGEEKEAESK
jgi:hypothetical protein